MGIYKTWIAVEKLWEMFDCQLVREEKQARYRPMGDQIRGLGCTLAFCMTARSKRTRAGGPGKPKSDIFTVLRKYLRQGTNLGVAIPVLSAHIDAARGGKRPAGLTEKQIQAKFRELSAKFFNSEYHPTYLHRAVGRFLVALEDRYGIRKELLSGVSVADLERLRLELLDSLRAAYEERQAVITKLKETCSLPDGQIKERYDLIASYLRQLGGNRGEMFEVVSFAVLREYFRTFGFSLQRFSTTHANDGGIDFVGGDAIYQVTADVSLQKLRRDLAKAPGTKRVLVRPGPATGTAEMRDGNILEVIELKDLLSHFISWLMARDRESKQAAHIQRVLKTALREFRRENWAQTAELASQEDQEDGGSNVALSEM
jgi:hypothetical protein